MRLVNRKFWSILDRIFGIARHR